MKYSLLFALFCINLSHGVFGLCCRRRFNESSHKETATEMDDSPYFKELAEFQLDFNRLSNSDAQFYTVRVENLGCLPNKHKSMKDIYQYSSNGNVLILRVGTPCHAMFIIGQYPVQVILFERLVKGMHEYFAVSIQVNPDMVSQETIVKKTVDQEIYKFGSRFAEFFVSDMPLRDLIEQLNEFPVKIMFGGIKMHPITVECKDIALWRIKFPPAIDSPLACQHFLSLCLNRTEEGHRLYSKPELVNQAVYVPINFPNNKAVIKIKLPSQCSLCANQFSQ